MCLAISASFEIKTDKKVFLSSARIKTETLKRIFRICHELKIIETKRYIQFETSLQEISKMINGWIRYLTQKEL